MSLIKPFTGLRPAPGRAAEVLAPPYDVMNTEEAREMAANRPWSFLHISKPEIDLPVDTDPYDAKVYAKGAENFERMIAEGVLVRDETDCYYAYRITMGEHQQTGLVAGASVAAYDRNDVRKHEFTRPKKEDDRVRQIDALNAQTGPVFLTYKGNDTVDGILASCAELAPEVDVTMDDDVRHELWVIRDPAVIQTLTQAFDDMGVIYVADGHHRSAAASRVASMRREVNNDPQAGHEHFLTVIFPDHQMQILDYNRVVRDLNQLDKATFLDRVRQSFDCEAVEQAVKPGSTGQFGMYLKGQWYALQVNPDLVPDDPVKRLDVSVLADNLIAPILGISDPRTDDRIDFVGGIRGLAELEKRVDSDEMAVAFSLYPTSILDLMAVADDDQVMPPKSTWFEPKLADGMVSKVLD
jgi:uncharacterized protein (DUF1015 family)